MSRLSYYPKKDRKIADIEIGSTKSAYLYFKLVLYPPMFRSGEFLALREHLEILFQITYEELFYNGKVSYIELAADSITYPIHTFIPFRPRINESTIWQSNGQTGSQYFGSETSKKRFCIYDKAKQLSQKKTKGAHPIRTRFEARLRHIGMAPCEVATNLANPFSSLEIADLVKARVLSNDACWQAFIDDCLKEGSAHSLSQCSKPIRKKYISMIRECAASWWKPDKLWKALPSALQIIAP